MDGAKEDSGCPTELIAGMASDSEIEYYLYNSVVIYRNEINSPSGLQCQNCL